MHRAEFTKNAPGSLVNTIEDQIAFVPNPLPDKLNYSQINQNHLFKASSSLGELNSLCNQIKNPYILTVPYIFKEALASSSIEGTQATMNDLLVFKATNRDESTDSSSNEVLNYIEAMLQGIDSVKSNKLPLSLRLIRNLHARLLKGVRGEKVSPGEFRISQNWIGNLGDSIEKAKYIPPPPKEMKEALHNWEEFIYTDTQHHPLVKCALMHYQFEAIHPFYDGNGRLGRLLVILYLIQEGLLKEPILYLSRYFETHRNEYYERLENVSKDGRWYEWIDYFHQAFYTQAESALQGADAIVKLYDSILDEINQHKRVPRFARIIINELFQNIYTTITQIVKTSNTDYNNVKRGMDFLEKNEFVEKIELGTRAQYYHIPLLLKHLKSGF